MRSDQDGSPRPRRRDWRAPQARGGRAAGAAAGPACRAQQHRRPRPPIAARRRTAGSRSCSSGRRSSGASPDVWRSPALPGVTPGRTRFRHGATLAALSGAPLAAAARTSQASRQGKTLSRASSARSISRPVAPPASLIMSSTRICSGHGLSRPKPAKRSHSRRTEACHLGGRRCSSCAAIASRLRNPISEKRAHNSVSSNWEGSTSVLLGARRLRCRSWAHGKIEQIGLLFPADTSSPHRLPPCRRLSGRRRPTGVQRRQVLCAGRCFRSHRDAHVFPSSYQRRAAPGTGRDADCRLPAGLTSTRRRALCEGPKAGFTSPLGRAVPERSIRMGIGTAASRPLRCGSLRPSRSTGRYAAASQRERPRAPRERDEGLGVVFPSRRFRS